MINDNTVKSFVFFGTPEFAAIVLENLIKADWIPAVVVCNPDRPVGRKKIISPSPVKARLLNYDLRIKNEITILQPKEFESIFLNLKSRKPDFAIVAAYGKIISKEILDIFPKGVIGVHPSLLPEYRGPSPIQAAILNGDLKTGVSLFFMDEKIDHGPIIAHQELRIINYELRNELEKRLAELSANLLINILPQWLNGEIKSEPQNEIKAIYTKKFVAEDGFVDLQNDNFTVIERKIRALNPEPGVFTYINPVIISELSQGGCHYFDEIKGRTFNEEDLPDKQKRVKLLEAYFEDNHLIINKIQPDGQRARDVKIIL